MKERASGSRRLARVLLPAAALVFVVSLFMRNRLPDKSLILEPLLQNPVQSDEGVPEPFEVTRKKVDYTVTPLFSYELWGMIVSYHDASSFIDISHKQWNDFLNTKDICVIWGRNVETGVYERMRFRNRDFTCYYRYPDEAAAELFSENCLANNHLLPDSLLVTEIKSTLKAGWPRTASRALPTSAGRAPCATTAATAPARSSTSPNSRSCGRPTPPGARSTSFRSPSRRSRSRRSSSCNGRAR